MNRTQHLLRSIAVMSLALSASAVSAANLGALELGKSYEIKADFNDWSATFTPDKSGLLSVSSYPSLSLIPYANSAHSVEIPYQGDFVGSEGYVYTFNVEAGTKYFFFQSFVMNDAVLRLSMDNKLEITDTTIPEGGVLSCSGYGNIEFTFNIAATADKVILKVEDQTVDLTNYTRFSGYYISVSLKEAILSLLTQHPEVGDKPCQLTISGLRAEADETNVYGADGTYTANYVLGALPAQLVSDNSNGFKLYSYFAPGAPEGKFNLTFDKSLDTTSGSAFFIFGNPEGAEGECYQEFLPVTVTDKVATIDFTGKVRRTRDMVKSGTNYGFITLEVTTIKNADGQYVYSDGEGTLGSFTYMLPYSEISLNLACEFTPMPGSPLNNVDEIEIYVNDGASISFDGVIITWDGNEDGTIIAKDNCKVEADSYGGLTITFALPAEAKTAKNVKVDLYNLTTTDGLDHSRDISAVYNAFVITSLSPADGSQLYQLQEGTKIVVNTNMNDAIGYFTYEISDLATGTIFKSVDMLTRADNGSWEAYMYQDYRLTKFHTYELTFTAYAQEADSYNGVGPIGIAKAYYEGLTAPFTFSDVKFVSATPAHESTITSADQNQIVLTFDGLVRISENESTIRLGFDMEAMAPVTANFESIEAQNPQSGYSNAWTLTVPKTELTVDGRTDFAISVRAYDENGMLVEGNEGEEENSFILLSYFLDIDLGGIEDVVSQQPSLYRVYDLSGRHVITTPNATALSNLRGIYIVNGKKIKI